MKKGLYLLFSHRYIQLDIQLVSLCISHTSSFIGWRYQLQLLKGQLNIK
jgi:hypothetical protein